MLSRHQTELSGGAAFGGTSLQSVGKHIGESSFRFGVNDQLLVRWYLRIDGQRC